LNGTNKNQFLMTKVGTDCAPFLGHGATQGALLKTHKRYTRGSVHLPQLGTVKMKLNGHGT